MPSFNQTSLRPYQGDITESRATVADDADSTLSAASSNRRYLAIYNNGSAPLWVTFDGTTPTANSLAIPAGDGKEYVRFVPQNAITARSSSGNLAVLTQVA